MIVKELKEILAKYDDNDTINISIEDCMGSFLLTRIYEDKASEIRGVILEVTLPDDYCISDL